MTRATRLFLVSLFLLLPVTLHAQISNYLLTAPGSVDPMVPFTMNVTARDAGGNTVNDSTTTFTIEGGAQFFLGGAWTPVFGHQTLVSGTFSVQVRLTSSGPKFFGLTDQTGKSGNVTVTGNALQPASFVVDPIASQTAGIPFTIRITAKDASNATMTSFSGTVSIGTVEGSEPSFTSIPFFNGVLNAQAITLTGAGSRRVLVSGIGAQSQSAPFTVNAGPLSAFTFDPIGAVSSGTPFNVTIHARDAFGNAVPSFTGSVVLGVDSGSVSPNSTGAFAAGVRTESVTLTTTGGSRTLTATNSAGSETGSSAPFTSSGVLDHFAIAPIATQVAGSSFNVVMTAQDASNNTVTAFNGTVEYTGDNAGFNTVPPGNFVNGTRTESIQILIAGTRTVTVTRLGGGESGSSASFVVTPADLAKFTFLPVPPQTAGAPFNLTITARDSYNNAVTSYNDTITFGTNNGTVSPVTSSPFSGGVLTQSITLVNAGTHTLTLSNAVTSSFGVNPTITVVAGSGALFEISAIGTQSAGALFNVTVTARDSSGNVATSFNGTVNFSLNSGSVSPAVSNAFVNGVLSQSITIAQSGSKVLTVTNTAGTENGISNGFTVDPAGVDHFLVSPVGPQVAGTPFSVTLTAQDAANNTVTSFSGTVTATVDAGSVTPATSPAFSNGTATYSLSVSQAGTRTITFTQNGGPGSGITGAFSVVPGATQQFTFDAIGSQTAGVSFPVTITARDSSGNWTPSFSGTVALTTPDGSVVNPSLSNAFVGGTVTQNVSLEVSGGKQLTATSGSSTGSSNAFNISPAPLHHFLINNPSQQIAGTPFIFGLSARDAFDNLVDFAGTVNFSVDGGTITPAASGAFTSGQAIASVTLTASGSRTITATRSGGTESGSTTITVQPAVEHHFTFAPISGIQVAGTPFAVTITAFDVYDNLATNYAGNVGLSADAGSVTPSTTPVFSNGAVTLNVSVTAAGTRTLTARTQAPDISNTSMPFTVRAGAPSATQSAVSASPSNVLADGTATSTISVTLRDQHANPISGVTVSLAGNAPSSIAGISPVTNTGGLATFSVSNAQSGPVVYTASAPGVQVTQTATVTFGGGVIAALEATIPAGPHQAGTGFAVTVRAVDSFGNLASSFTGPRFVSFSMDPSAAIVPTFRDMSGTSMPFGPAVLNFANGSATTLVTMFSAGSFGITVSAPGAPEIQSSTVSTVTVFPAAAGAFRFANTPAEQYVGVPLGSGTLTILDSFGNVLTAFNAAATPVFLTPCDRFFVGPGRGCALDQASDFINGVASLSTVRYHGVPGAIGLTALRDAATATVALTFNAATVSSVTPGSACSDWATDLQLVITGDGLLPGGSVDWNGQGTFALAAGATANTQTITIPWHLAPRAGTSARILIYDIFGNPLTPTGTAPSFSTVEPLTAQASNDGPTCVGNTASLFGATSSTETSFLWRDPAGNTVSTLSQFSFPMQTDRVGEYAFVVQRPLCRDAVARTTLVEAPAINNAVTVPPRAVAGSTTQASVVEQTPGASYKWTVTGGSIVGANNGPSISWIPNDTDFAVVAVAISTGGEHGCRAPATRRVEIERCTQPPPTLHFPSPAARIQSPITFGWSTLANATSYELVIQKQNVTIRKTVNAHEATVALPQGDFTWSVTANVPNCPARIVSATSSLTVLDGPNCTDSPVASTINPLDGAVVSGTKVNFRWTAVPGARSYFVFASINGAPVADIGGVDAPATELVANIGADGPVAWFVVAYFDGCEGKPSNVGFFSRPYCSSVPSLISADGFDPKKVNQTVTFRWNRASSAFQTLRLRSFDGSDHPIILGDRRHDDGLRLPLEADSVTVSFAMPLQLTWSVEAFSGSCGSLESPRLPLQREFEACSAGSGAVTLLQPLANAPLNDANPVLFRWTNPSSAYRTQLLLSRDGGPFAVVADDGGVQTSATLKLPLGDYRWMVRAQQVNTSGSVCARDSEIIDFTVGPCDAPGATAAQQSALGKPVAGSRRTPTNRAPVIKSPGGMAMVASDEVKFEWGRHSDVAGYRLQVGKASGQLLLDIPLSMPPEGYCRRKGDCTPTLNPSHVMKNLSAGLYYWILTVEYHDRCETQAVKNWFTITPKPCGTVPTITVPYRVDEADEYDVSWNEASLTGIYELQEFRRLGGPRYDTPVDPVTYTVKGTSVRFKKSVSNEFDHYIYRVRPLDCTKTYSPIATMRVHRNNSLGSAIEYAFVDLYRELIVEFPSTQAGQTLTAIGNAFSSLFVKTGGGPSVNSSTALTYRFTPDVPWLTIEPSSGEYKPTQLKFIYDTTNLPPMGTATAYVKLEISDGRPAVFIPITVAGRPDTRHTGKVDTDPRAIIVPTAAHVQGIGAVYRSDLRISNLSSEARQYDLAYSPSGSMQSSNVNFGVGPGQTIALDDVLINAPFITSDAGSAGYLQIKPLVPAGEEDATVVTSRTFARTASGTFGDFIAPVKLDDFAGSGDIVTLMPVEESSRRRTNIVFLAASGADARLRVVTRNASGTVVGEFPLLVPGGERMQLNGPLAERGISVESGRIDVHVEDGYVNVHASMLDRRTNDSSIIPGVRGSRVNDNEYVLAGLGHVFAGNGTWRSDLYVTNAGAAATTATLRYFTADGKTPANTSVSLAAGETRLLRDVLPNLLGATNTIGSLRATTPESSSVILAAVTYLETAKGSLGQVLRSQSVSKARGIDDEAFQISGAAQSLTYRTNLGIAEVSGQPVTVEIHGVTSDGREAFERVELSANGFMQITSIATRMQLSGDNIRFAVKVIAGEGRVVAYGSLLDNATGDPSYIQAQ